ncbi:MAG: helix-turn-helix domain-containing protein [Dokdonella sp.]
MHQETTLSPADALTSRELSSRIGRSPVTLERWRRHRIGPPFFRICGRVLYDPADVASWIEAQKKATGMPGGIA